MAKGLYDDWFFRLDDVDDNLSYEQMIAGGPCSRCGAPWVDGVEGPQGGTRNWSPDDWARDAAAKAGAKERHQLRGHPDCPGVFTTLMQGSSTIHCIRCCPPPPMSPEVIERVAQMLRPYLSKPRQAPVSESAEPPSRASLEAKVKRAEARARKLRDELKKLT